MKVRCDITLDLETGDYDLKVHNLTKPGEPMDYLRIRAVLRRIFEDVDDQQARQPGGPP